MLMHAFKVSDPHVDSSGSHFRAHFLFQTKGYVSVNWNQWLEPPAAPLVLLELISSETQAAK